MSNNKNILCICTNGGAAKPFLPEPYNWKTYPAMNVSADFPSRLAVGSSAKIKFNQ